MMMSSSGEEAVLVGGKFGFGTVRSASNVDGRSINANEMGINVTDVLINDRLLGNPDRARDPVKTRAGQPGCLPCRIYATKCRACDLWWRP